MTDLVLPFPPSLNRLWRNVRGRTLISAEGRSYRARVQEVCLLGRPVALGEGLLDMRIVAWLPDARRRDADNLFKAALDALAHAGVYADDSQITRLSIHKAGIDRENPRLEISLLPYSEKSC